ncbi:RloB family protein [Phytohabitans flavus]|uniref:RloB-like protein n=1 Tax=Phytohabitans flavus TaxID=1076124 RepID=A0A6F8XQM7_9ACTN|nr:RloB family protein [Phytohabitans flavus]BCB76058.1 hypothetical protein Pflav_024680 [Phytohabitans flavus]
MRRRDSSAARQAASQRRHTVLIYCGAVRTEPDYFDGLRKQIRGQTVTIKVRQQGVSPKQLVQAAAAYRDRKPGSFDEVWCVVDVDQFDIEAAVTEARRNDINLAVSNPCFELWLLLHHAECRAHCAGYEDVLVRLKKHVPGYDKARLDFADHVAGIGDATKRAKELGGDHTQNPSTGMWRLVEMVREQS